MSNQTHSSESRQSTATNSAHESQGGQPATEVGAGVNCAQPIDGIKTFMQLFAAETKALAPWRMSTSPSPDNVGKTANNVDERTPHGDVDAGGVWIDPQAITPPASATGRAVSNEQNAADSHPPNYTTDTSPSTFDISVRRCRIIRIFPQAVVAARTCIHQQAVYIRQRLSVSPFAPMGRQSGQTETSDQPATWGVPCVEIPGDDYVGIALSGGGVRSATFNLGLLQGMCRRDVLRYADFLSTVSGGGYIGGWWTRYIAKHNGPKNDGGLPFPGDGDCADSFPYPEAPAIRHLREFRAFLAPRWGFTQMEMWTGWLTMIRALTAGLITTVSLLVLGIAIWRGVAELAWYHPASFTATIFLAVNLFYERLWRTYSSRAQSEPNVFLPLIGAIAIGVAVSVGVAYLLTKSDLWQTAHRMPESFAPHLPPTQRLIALNPILSWLAAAGVLIVTSTISRRWVQFHEAAACERVVARLLAIVLVWSILSLLWIAGCWMYLSPDSLYTAVGLAAVMGTGFWQLRDWLNQFARDLDQINWRSLIREAIPQILATATLALLVTATIAMTLYLVDLPIWNEYRWLWVSSIAAVIGVVMLVAVDPNKSGLHEFYRQRIARTYLGASGDESAADDGNLNRHTQMSSTDDFQLKELPDRPIQLICCTLNDRTGDPLANLSLNAWSATLSKFGLSFFNLWAGAGKTSVGQSLAASAAAFNPNMGFWSIRFGKAATILMAVLNLRLGLWISTNKGSFWSKIFPGHLYLKEMFGRIGVSSRRTHQYVHLTDGGHFDNLGLYELIRRHCRYIIVSDCGADPKYEFDDFGNVLRRVRADFHVDIDIDFGALHPDKQGFARQHVVVGTIKYPTDDHGMLLYIKPTLTGDEPADIAQYKSSNLAFPHDPTVNQFYGEAQWESYRCLGSHIGESVFAFASRIPKSPQNPLNAGRLFAHARWTWFPTPADMKRSNPHLTQRWVELQRRLLEMGPSQLRQELFPELTRGNKRSRPAQRIKENNTFHTILLIQDAMTLFEDIWEGGKFEDVWSHPLNLGWVNYAERWMAAPTVRWWWPLIKPMFSPGFAHFIEERCPFMTDGAPQFFDRVEEVRNNAVVRGFAQHYWDILKPDGSTANVRNAAQIVYAFMLRSRDGSQRDLQAGLAKLTIENATHATWKISEFFIPPGLSGSGIRSKFVQRLLQALAQKGIRRATVSFPFDSEDEKRKLLRALRLSVEDIVQFYRREGFGVTRDPNGYVFERDVPPQTTEITTCQAGKPDVTPVERHESSSDV